MSSISSAYKLQIEKLTNKINQLILENRKLNNFIYEGNDTTGGSGTGGSGTGGSGGGSKGPPAWTPNTIPGMKPDQYPINPDSSGDYDELNRRRQVPTMDQYYDPNNPNWFAEYLQALLNYYDTRFGGFGAQWWQRYGKQVENFPYLPDTGQSGATPMFPSEIPTGLLPFSAEWWQWWLGLQQLGRAPALNPIWLQRWFEEVQKYGGQWTVSPQGFPILVPPSNWPQIPPGEGPGFPVVIPGQYGENGNPVPAGPNWSPPPDDPRRYRFDPFTNRWYFDGWDNA
jgi:hypothetical protein